LERLGAGSSAVTYRARCESNGADVALKTLTLRGRGRSTNGGFKAVELFERECATLRALDFERVPEYVDSFTLDSEFDRRYVLVQRLAVGRNLEDKVGEGWRPTEREAREILRQLLETLEYTSSLRPPVVHRDVKPANVVIDDDGERVFLVDFGGAAAAAIDSDSFGSTVVGTFGYMAPETLMGGSSPKSDQYGVGEWDQNRAIEGKFRRSLHRRSSLALGARALARAVAGRSVSHASRGARRAEFRRDSHGEW
jgi:serine/threonine protein kinase